MVLWTFRTFPGIQWFILLYLEQRYFQRNSSVRKKRIKEQKDNKGKGKNEDEETEEETEEQNNNSTCERREKASVDSDGYLAFKLPLSVKA